MNLAYESNQEGPAPQRRRKLVLAPIIVAVILLAVNFYGAESFTNPETGQSMRVGLSVDQESALGLSSFREVLSQSRVVPSGPTVDMSRRVAQRLITAVDENSKKFAWAVEVIESEQMNAFCLPGGKIAVYTGIIPVAKDDDGLAAVMGHEIAHATARHGAQRLFQQNLVQIAMSGVSGATAEMDPRERQTILGVLGAGVQFGIILPYGRDHESEADKMGLIYLIRSGYRPEASVEFWQRMESAGGSQPPEWLSTHPSHGTRINDLKRYIEEYRDHGTVGGLSVVKSQTQE